MPTISRDSGPQPSTRERFGTFWEEAFRARLRIWQIMPLAGWWRVAALVVLGLMLGALPLVFMIATSVMIGGVPEAVENGIGSADWDVLVRLFLIGAGAFMVQQILAPVQQMLGLSVQRVVDGKIRDSAVRSVTSAIGIAALEDGEVLSKFSEARNRFENNFFTPGNAVGGMLFLIARYTQLFALLAIIWMIFGPAIAVALTIAIFILRTGNRGGLRVYSALWRANGHLRRRFMYMRDITLGSIASKEIRIFGSMPWLHHRYRDSFHSFTDPTNAERRRIYFKPYLVYTAVALVAAVWALISLVSRAAGTGDDAGELALGTMSLQALTLGLQALVGALMLARDYPESDTSTQFGMNALSALREVESAITEADTAPRGTRDVPEGTPHQGIEFRDLHFNYPGADEVVFAGLNLTLEAGKSTALVGVNGAGKTTLMKLLARLYEPTAGAIYVDGIDITEFDIVQWRHALSVVFQDFVQYEFSAADNIAAGAASVPHDREAVAAAAQATGILDTLAASPHGLDTTLARGYADGVDLSGGQWQRVAIARSLYALAKGARVLVLDEPTAALDVRAEAEFFDQFVDLTHGATTLLISHRFSSVRRADRIVVIELGRVIEEGSHADLMASDTHYRRLFELQARRFREGLDVDEDADADVMGGAR